MGAPLRRIDTDNRFSEAIFNELADAIESHAAYMLGRGVVSGMDLSDEGGFILGIASGRASNGLRLVATPDLTKTIPPSVTRYVWVAPEIAETDPATAVTLTATSADPGGSLVPVGSVTTDGSGIVSFDESPASGRVELGRFSALRTFKLGGAIEVDLITGRVGIGKTPTVPLDVEGELAATELSAPLGTLSVLALPQVGASPSAPADAALFYTKNVAGVAEVFVQCEGGLETQLTSLGRFLATYVAYRQMTVEATDTRANSTAENAFASKLAIPSDTPRARQLFRIRARGVYGSKASSPGNLTIRLKYGTALASCTIPLTAAMTNQAWDLEADVLIRTIGATGTAEVQGTVTVFTAAGAAVPFSLVNTGEQTIDTTATADLGLTVQFDTADSANTITQRLLIIESSLD